MHLGDNARLRSRFDAVVGVNWIWRQTLVCLYRDAMGVVLQLVEKKALFQSATLPTSTCISRRKLRVPEWWDNTIKANANPPLSKRNSPLLHPLMTLIQR